MFRIGDFSKLSKVSVKALRYYERIGLLHPIHVDGETGYRFYSATQLPKVNRILALKALGFSLEQVAQVLNENDAEDQFASFLKLKRLETIQQLQSEQDKLSQIDHYLRLIEQEHEMNTYEVSLKKIEPQPVIAIREVISSIWMQGPLWEKLVNFLWSHKIDIVGPPTAIFHNDEYREQEVDIELIAPVESPVEVMGSFKLVQMPELEVACVLYKGNPNGLPQAYAALSHWIEENGYQPCAPHRKIYYSFLYKDHEAAKPYEAFMTKDIENCVTEIQWPVQKI